MDVNDLAKYRSQTNTKGQVMDRYDLVRSADNVNWL